MEFPEGLKFRDERITKAHFGRDLSVMLVLLLLVTGVMVYRSIQMESDPESSPSPSHVRVRGQVEAPGWVQPRRMDIHSAILAAGGSVEGVENAPISAGWTVEVGENKRIRLSPSAEMLVFGLPLPLNSVDASALEALPGIGPSKAARIVADRELNGDFRTVDELQRVRGIGPHTLDQLRPFLEAGSATVPEER